MSRYRIFISYQSDDQPIAIRIKEALERSGHYPFLDVKMATPGTSITAQIKSEIARSHFLVPIVTSDSVWQRAWVNQEIGFGLACNVQVVPILVSATRNLSGMVTHTTPVEIKDLPGLEAELGEVDWGKIHEEKIPGCAIFEYDRESSARACLLAEKAKEIHKRYGRIRLRQHSSLTSFSLPRDKSDANWVGVNVDQFPWFVPEERINVEEVSEARDIFVDMNYYRSDYDKRVQVAKLRTLRDFLDRSDDDGGMRVVFKRFDPSEGVTILGNYWALQSAVVGPSATKRHTFSTWHASTVDEYCHSFDKEFEELYEKQKVRGCTPRGYAIARIDEAINTYSSSRKHGQQ